MSDTIGYTTSLGDLKHAMQICGPTGQPVVTIYFDGRVELAPGVSTDEAAQGFWKAVEDAFPNALYALRDRSIKDEREACAKIADEIVLANVGIDSQDAYGWGQYDTAEEIASVIRARGTR